MAGRAFARLSAAFFVAILVPASAQAQTLARLDVESFALTADTTTPQVDTPFRLIVTLRVRERVAQIDNLNLPDFAQLELLGDERETASGPRGTEYRETISVVAHDGGELTIAPATLQAIDARDGRAKEWFTNDLKIRIAGRRALPASGALFWGARLAAWVLLAALGAGVLATVIGRLLRRRPKRAPAAPLVAAAAPPARVRTLRDQARDALTVLRANPSRTSAVTVRSAIWRMAGAPEGATLGDALQRPIARDIGLRGLLIALERSAFTSDNDLKAAIEDTCSALARYLESPA
jgi:hypothetical protein